MAVGGLCLSCGFRISYVEPGLDPDHHINCGPNFSFGEPDGPDPFNEATRRDVTEVIEWAEAQAPRSGQVMVGPSELGQECDRQLAYRIAGAGAVNDRVDSWPATVGTAVHQWFEHAVQKFQAEAGVTRWLTELEVYPDDAVVGHTDLFDLETGTCWDLKTSNGDKIKAMRESGPPADYRTQVHLYGLGMTRAGYTVNRVGLIVVPRSGWLSAMWVWSEPYDEQIAAEALTRMYRIAEQVLELAVDEHPEQMMAVEATPSRLCSFCQFYTPEPVDGVGCPGR